MHLPSLLSRRDLLKVGTVAVIAGAGSRATAGTHAPRAPAP